MPIGGDRFEDIDDDGPAPGTNAHAILTFLAASPDRAFTQTEIAEATDLPRGSVGPTLVRLRERGRVEHRGTYWRIAGGTDADAGDADDGDADSTDADPDPPLADPPGTTDGSLDYDDWQAHAVDPRGSGEQGYGRGAVVWADDDGGRRPWLVLDGGSLPYVVREYTCVALTASDLPGTVVVDAWAAGGHPDRVARCAPFRRRAVAHADVVAPQGAVDPAFADRVARASDRYREV